MELEETLYTYLKQKIKLKIKEFYFEKSEQGMRLG